MYLVPGTIPPRRIQLAENPRTQVKANIKRASKTARADMRKMVKGMERNLEQAYRGAVEDLRQNLEAAAVSGESLRLTTMQDLLGQAEARLAQLEQTRNDLLDQGLLEAADKGVAPFAAEYAKIRTPLTQLADDAVRFTVSFVAEDGLQLSDRLWAIDNGARESVTRAIQSSIIQGHSASQAAQEFLARGEAVPKSIAQKASGATPGQIHKTIRSELLTGEGSAYSNALRVFRTEINRAHGEAYQATAFEHPDVIGTRFLLSPRHPRVDICDMHAKVNRYGLGPGVYPKGKNPWPAHPNTLSFVEAVFDDEVTEDMKLGKTDRVEWLRGQAPRDQVAILGKNKAAALQAALLKENHINTPWSVLHKRYARKGIDVENLKPVLPPPSKLKGTVITGIDPAELRQHMSKAMEHATAAVNRLVEKTAKPDGINVIPRGTSYFQGKSITLARTSMVERSYSHSRHDVFRHEYGHFIDFWAMSPDGKRPGPRITLTKNSQGGLHDSMQKAKTALYARGKAGKAKVERLRSAMLDHNDLNLADFFGSLTKNRIGWGHSKSYLANYGMPETEAFANLFDIYSRKDRKAWNLIEAELPDLATDFVALIKRLAQ